MKLFKKPNVFFLLAVAATFGLLFRIADMAVAVAETKEHAPALTKEHVEKDVKETAKAVDEGKTEHAGEHGETVVKGAERAESSNSNPVNVSPSFTVSEIGVLQSLAGRREELDRREKTIAQREALLKAAEQGVDRKITELNKLKSDMESLLGQQQKAEEGRIGSLVKIYENMKPPEAARIFDTLDMPILLDVIGRMNERKVSPVLAAMNPQKAKDVTIKLAEQRKLPPVKADKP